MIVSGRLVTSFPPGREAQELDISKVSWRLIDQKNTLRRLPGTLNQTASRYLTCSLKATLKEDRKQQAAAAGALAEAELNQGRIREA